MSTNSFKMDIHFKIRQTKFMQKNGKKNLLLPFVKIFIK